MNCTMPELTGITYSRKGTTAAIHLLRTRRRVRFATREVDQRSSWFQQEHSVRKAGPPSTPDIWSRIGRTATQDRTTRSAAATSVRTRHRKLLLAEVTRTKRGCIPWRSPAGRCHAQRTSTAESWPVSSARNDARAEEEIARSLYNAI